MIANYAEEQNQFRALLESDGDPRILMFQGESGSGKSHLIKHCLDQVLPSLVNEGMLAGGMPVAHIDLQASGDHVQNLWVAMGSKVGWHHLPTFTKRVVGLTDSDLDGNDPVSRVYIRRFLRQIGQIQDWETRREQMQLLTDAWFMDVERFKRPLIVAVDRYEQRSNEFDLWFREEFLEGVADTDRVRVIVGGQSVPELTGSWPGCMSLHELRGVMEAEEWLRWGSAQGIEIQGLEYMAGICKALEGKPNEIVQLLASFPKLSAGVENNEQTVYLRRKHFRQTVNGAFGLEELKDICHDMEINYEDLPPNKMSFIRELIAHLERTGRFEEFGRICRGERPNADW